MSDDNTKSLTIKDGPEWTLRIRDVTLGRFQRRLNSDLPTKYGQTINHNENAFSRSLYLELKRRELGDDEISFEWQVGNERAVRMRVAHYTNDSLTVILKRYFSFNAMERVEPIAQVEFSEVKAKIFSEVEAGTIDLLKVSSGWSRKEGKWWKWEDEGTKWEDEGTKWEDEGTKWEDEGTKGEDDFPKVRLRWTSLGMADFLRTEKVKRFIVCGGTMYVIPWTEEQEFAVVHGRELVSWLLAWLQEKYYAEFTATPPERFLKPLEGAELRSPIRCVYFTTEGQRLWEEREHARKKTESDKPTSALTSQAADQGEEQPALQAEADQTSGGEKRGPYAGTLERVREAHELLKTQPGSGRTRIFKRAGTDSRTYADRCKEATGEEPILST